MSTKPGPELAARVAVEVMGWPRTQSTEESWGKRPFVAEFTGREGGGINVYAVGNNNWRPDRDIAAAWEVVEWMDLQADRKVRGRFEFTMEGMWCAPAKEVALEICLAALAAIKSTTTD